jgi:hypothetical protein
MNFVLIGYDAQGRNDSPLAIYILGDRIARVDASLIGPELEAAICQQLGLDQGVLDTLTQQWQVIQNQIGTRPLATMDMTQVTTWLNSNITDPVQATQLRTALIALTKELFYIRAQNRIFAEIFRGLLT